MILYLFVLLTKSNFSLTYMPYLYIKGTSHILFFLILGEIIFYLILYGVAIRTFIIFIFPPGYIDVFSTLRSSCLYRQHSRTLKSICSDLQYWPGMKQQLYLF